MTTGRALADTAPRECDCDFCTRHAAAWVSDAQGALRIRSRDGALLRYRQGSGQAQFLLCTRCGVLVAVIARSQDGRWLGAANRNAFDDRARFGAPATVSPQQLGPEEKLARWTQLWTPAELAED
ncbi:GFA family protein [Agrilutibacter solisilvae]|uniref:Aldehyde-activating protein n=1 Tax=Agrilutibacter solisilvae TaxID=2763317 RepID=A0A975AR94_9GAMM|nr:aldehyde-activating protein [Lysobacter solisilvae]QSX77048.1 aldehyde-activating protein [Lysobacter solisilvae]